VHDRAVSHRRRGARFLSALLFAAMPDDERSYPALSGRAWRLPEGWDGALPDGLRPGDFLVGGAACGRSLDAAIPSRLRSAGVAGLIAASIDPAFFAASLAAGLPAIAIEEAAAILAGDLLRVDIETFRVANRASGDRYIVRNLGEEELRRLRAAIEDDAR
jgi:hypothetical protein